MGEVREKINLIRARDAVNFIEGIIKKEDIKQATVDMIVDTGAWTMVLSEETSKKLGLVLKERNAVTVAGGVKMKSFSAEAVEVHWNDRQMVIDPVVIPGEKNNLLGALVLEGLNLMVDPANQRLIASDNDTFYNCVK